jgi:hypothetical protein
VIFDGGIGVWIVLLIHNPNILAQWYGRNEVIFHPYCHWRACYHCSYPKPYCHPFDDAIGWWIMPLLGGNKGFSGRTRQLSVGLSVPRRTLLAHKLGNMQSHDMNGDKKTITQQSTIVSE